MKLTTKIMRIALRLWMSPLFVAGMCCAYFFHRRGARLQRFSCAQVVRGDVVDRFLKHYPTGSVIGLVVGHCILIRSDADARTRSHEIEHVRQAAMCGILFPVLYVLASLWQIVQGKHWYVDNPFEIKARSAEIKAKIQSFD